MKNQKTKNQFIHDLEQQTLNLPEKTVQSMAATVVADVKD